MVTNPAASPRVGGAQAAANPLTKSLTKSDEFLRMLLTQLTNQDPLNPMSGSEMTQQMVGIQQIQSMDTLQKQIESMNKSSTISAASILGKTVELRDPDDGSQVISGTVSSVRQSSGELQVVVQGKAYSMDLINSISQ